MINGTLTKSEQNEQDALDRFYNARQLRIEDGQFAIVALNLSGNRDELEHNAMELIDTYGMIKALQISRVTKEQGSNISKEKEFQIAVGKRVRKARKRLGLTQEDLAEQMEKNSRQTIAQIEGGKRKLTAPELLNIMDITGQNLEYFTDPYLAIADEVQIHTSIRPKNDRQGPVQAAIARMKADQTAREDRQLIMRAAIEGVVVPENYFDKAHPIPPHIKEIIRGLKIDGAFSFRTVERDIWQTLYRLHLQTTGEKI